ncbi:THAP domain-containing protein 3 isoform X1 [Hemiscyllium ocellatum]|uniref:THAP domain-containing protein 3 isoform X1 n=1 Tax=Hemiscyllium ocellatum TaxID=170820 RepID=UPI0029661E43|nr:THAP domain-containing protein 3 isoform X1 [Hemiscyllium ocellatum]
MPKSCAAYNCTNRYSSKNKELTFHRFPFSKPDLLVQWMNNVGRAEFKPNQHTVICSEHFKPECFNTWGNRKNLKHNAVPTVFSYSEIMKQRHRARKKLKTAADVSKPEIIEDRVETVPMATTSRKQEKLLQAVPTKVAVSDSSADHTYAATNLGMMKKRLFTALEKNEKLRKRLKVKQEEMRRMMKKWQAVKDELEDLRAKSLLTASGLNLAGIAQLQRCMN